jgi:phosphoserine phosphatase
MHPKEACRIKLVAFDVDGVLVPIRSSWGYVHEKLGTTRESEINYNAFKNGVIRYWEWMYLDTLAWIEARPGITKWDLVELFSEVRLSPGAEEAVKELRRKGLEVALVSGGVEVLVEKVAELLGIKHWVCPALSYDPWGRLVPGGEPRLEADRKDRAVLNLAKRLGLSLRNVAFVGDSYWDLRGMREACLAVAVNPSDDRVVEEADYVAKDLLDAARFIIEHAES